MQIEKNYLIKNNRKELASKVRIVESDGYGYDIISYDLSGKEKHIEVKTSKLDSKKAKFYLSDFEKKTLENDENYELYYLFDIDKEEPSFIKYNRKELSKLLEKYMKPIQYAVEFGFEK